MSERLASCKGHCRPTLTDHSHVFAVGTTIRTPEGSKPIEDVKPGDVIQTQPDDCEDNHEPEDHDDDHTGEDARW